MLDELWRQLAAQVRPEVGAEAAHPPGGSLARLGPRHRRRHRSARAPGTISRPRSSQNTSGTGTTPLKACRSSYSRSRLVVFDPSLGSIRTIILSLRPVPILLRPSKRESELDLGDPAGEPALIADAVVLDAEVAQHALEAPVQPLHRDAPVFGARAPLQLPHEKSIDLRLDRKPLPHLGNEFRSGVVPEGKAFGCAPQGLLPSSPRPRRSSARGRRFGTQTYHVMVSQKAIILPVVASGDCGAGGDPDGCHSACRLPKPFHVVNGCESISSFQWFLRLLTREQPAIPASAMSRSSAGGAPDRRRPRSPGR